MPRHFLTDPTERLLALKKIADEVATYLSHLKASGVSSSDAISLATGLGSNLLFASGLVQLPTDEIPGDEWQQGRG